MALGRTRRTGQELFCRVAQVILCSLLIVMPCACNQPAKPNASSDNQKSSREVADTQPAKLQTADRATKSGGDKVVGDDIGIGLLRSLQLATPTYDEDFTPSAWKVERKSVAERDGKMRQLKAFIASRPASSSPIECFVGDAAYEAGGFEHYQSTMGVYYANIVTESDARFMSSLGMTRLGKRDWLALRPWMLKAATRTAPWMPKMSDQWEAVVFSYYDGSRWRIAPWFYLSCVPEKRNATETDIAIFTLIEYFNCKLQPPIAFASYYRTRSVLFVSEIREGIDLTPHQGRRRDDLGQKKAPETKPEEKPDAKSPAVAPK
jgi:hypothetical protein